MIYGSVCSGIEAASVAWHPLGWKPAFFSEISAFPRAVLAHRWPGIPLHADFTTIPDGRYEPIDLLVGGTPCQSFSIAGLRGGLADERGNLALEYLKLAQRLRPRWVVWENVPGVLSSDGGRDFGSFVGGLAELGYGWAYRILDAQHFGLAQRRKRVFVVGHLGDWRRAASVLFEPASLRRDSPPRRSERARDPGAAARDSGSDGDTICFPIERGNQGDGGNIGFGRDGDPVFTLSTGSPHAVGIVSFPWQQAGTMNMAFDEELSGTLTKSQTAAVMIGGTVRRLTPREYERLQGFPDDFTLVPYRGKHAADAPRYSALGNAMAVPVMAWIGRRIEKAMEAAWAEPEA